MHESGESRRLTCAAALSSSGGLARKMSCSVITSDSMRNTSVTWLIRREPSTSRVIWTRRSKALATCSRIARSGSVHEGLLAALDALDFYRLTPPRSLGREWFDAAMRPLITDPRIPLPDRLRTVTEHIARQLAKAISSVATAARDPSTR